MLGLDVETPYLLRVLGSLAAILVVNKLTRQLTLSMIIGTLLLAVWCGHSPAAVLHIAGAHALSRSNLLLMVVIMQVIWLSSQMSRTDSMKDLVDTVKGVLPARAATAVLPAIIGLLPMPGGAIFSAPLVDDADDRRELSPLLKTQINYWFRHLWEYWWPLYPGVILAIQLTGLSEPAFVALQLPLSLLAVLAGYLFLLRRVPKRAARRSGDHPWRRLLALTSPIFLLIGVYIVLKFVIGFLLPGAVNLPAAVVVVVEAKYFPMVIGILTAQLYLQWRRPLGRADWRQILLSRATVGLAVLVLFVTIYGAFVQATLPGGGVLMDRVRAELLGWGIPLLLVIMVVPFVAGVTTGIAVGMVGASFPVVLGLLGEAPSTAALLSTTALAYALGYMGMILSPVHVCLIVSNRHFKTNLSESLVGLIKPAAVVITGALILYVAIWYGAA
jgi:integral membrane protein (TIGR00529 family)